MDEEELCAGPEGVLSTDSGGCACFLLSRIEVANDGGAGVAEHVEVDDARGVHDEGRPAEKLVRATASRLASPSRRGRGDASASGRRDDPRR